MGTSAGVEANRGWGEASRLARSDMDDERAAGSNNWLMWVALARRGGSDCHVSSTDVNAESREEGKCW